MDEITQDGTIILDQPDSILYFSLLSLIMRIEMELETGLKWRDSNVQIAQRNWHTKSKRLKGTLVELEAIQEKMIAAKRTGVRYEG